MTRDDAYRLVQRNAMKSWKQGIEFKKLLSKDKEIRKHLTVKELNDIFNLKHFLRNINFVFKRVFGK
jgi:adenylosuccinate lyase